MTGLFWLASYPKSGNTWFRSFLTNLISKSAEPADINQLNTGAIASSRGWLDDVLGFDTADLNAGEIEALRPIVYDWAGSKGDPGFHKIHDALTKNCQGHPLISPKSSKGALYFVRNPLDVVTSFANHMNCSADKSIAMMANPDLILSRSTEKLDGQVAQKLLSWSDHVLSWTENSDIQVELIRYEDMLNDGLSTFERAARFLNLAASRSEIEQAIRFSDFRILKNQETESKFRERPAKSKSFFRKGQSGGWRTELNDKQISQIISDHGEVMKRLGYLDADGNPKLIIDSLLNNPPDMI